MIQPSTSHGSDYSDTHHVSSDKEVSISGTTSGSGYDDLELRNIFDKMMSFFDKSPDIGDTKIIDTIRIIGTDVKNQQINLSKVETEEMDIKARRSQLEEGIKQPRMESEKKSKGLKRKLEEQNGAGKRSKQLRRNQTKTANNKDLKRGKRKHEEQIENDEQLSLPTDISEAPKKKRPQTDGLQDLKCPRLSRKFKFSNKTLSQQTSLLQEKRDCPTSAQIKKGIHATYSAVDRTGLSHLSGRLSALLKRRERNEKVSVWPGTDLAESKTVFVCLYQGDMQKTKKYYKSIDIYYRDSEQLSRHLEPPHKMPVKNELNLSHENAKLLQQAIEEHGIDLFKHHTNLEAITGSSYILSKSKGYINCPSVVLYCRVKGIAPIGEDAFPKDLKVGDENKLVRIDVREGYFTHGIYKESTFCRTDWHDKLRMGTSIGAEAFDQGTLGPFVKISNTDTGFVTCAHVLIPDPRDESALQQSLGLKVYQPADNESHSKYEKPREERYCGDVSRIVFNPNVCDPVNGLSKTVGVDAALVIVKGNRNADIRSFPFIPDKDLKNAGFEPSHPPAFRHGSVAKYPLNFNEILGKRVIKYGRTTGLTRGTLGLDGTMVKVKDSLLQVPRTQETCLMRGQYTVEGTGNKKFFEPGDSGSGVFLLDEKNKLTCIGLAIGYIEDSWDCYTVVTPIEYVLKALGLPLDSMQFEKGTAVLEMTKSRTSVDPCISPSSGIERRSRRKRKANQTISIRKHCPSSANPFPEKRRKN